MPLTYLPSPGRSSWHAGPLMIRAESICVIAGILLAVWLTGRRYRKAGGSPGVILDVAAWAIPAALITAVIGLVLADRRQPGFWHTMRTADAAIGYPGAAVFGLAGAWLACRRMKSPRGERVRLGPIAGVAAPCIAFGQAVASLGNWLGQQEYGRPSSLWWAVEISPAHRLPGYENYATFQPVFLYQSLWDVAVGLAVMFAAKRFSMAGERVFALYAALYAVGGLWLGLLRIGQLPLVLGVRAGELGDAVVLVLAVCYLVRTRRMRSAAILPVRALESDSSGDVIST
jgi:prolipoprotein diacylglyceryltransferase